MAANECVLKTMVAMGDQKFHSQHLSTSKYLLSFNAKQIHSNPILASTDVRAPQKERHRKLLGIWNLVLSSWNISMFNWKCRNTSSATRFWHLMHPVQDCPDNCARKEQFDTNLLYQMASLIIMLSRRSSNLLQRYTLATIQLACLNCKAIVTGARSWALHLGKLPCGLLLPYQWLVWASSFMVYTFRPMLTGVYILSNSTFKD